MWKKLKLLFNRKKKASAIPSDNTKDKMVILPSAEATVPKISYGNMLLLYQKSLQTAVDNCNRFLFSDLYSIHGWTKEEFFMASAIVEAERQKAEFGFNGNKETLN